MEIEPDDDGGLTEPVIVEDESWRITALDPPQAPRPTDQSAGEHPRDEWRTRMGWQEFPSESLDPDLARTMLWFPPS